MYTRLFYFLAFICPYLGITQTRAQSNSFINFNDSLVRLSKKIINEPTDVERKNANYSFIKTLTNTLKLPNSFNLRFDSVKAITVINSPDNKFKIFSWHVANDDGTYRFYGTVQMNTANGKLLMHPLADYSPFIKNEADTITSNTRWYGAQYYSIIPVNGPSPYYILLGWKGNTNKSTKKVIEVLSFKNGMPVFGAPVFTGTAKSPKRIVFEYTRQASMLLKYLPQQQTIVFDHLAPPNKGMDGKFDYYGPDFTYDAYRLKNGTWQFADNVDMRNGATANDELADPKRQTLQDRGSISSRPNK